MTSHSLSNLQQVITIQDLEALYNSQSRRLEAKSICCFCKLNNSLAPSLILKLTLMTLQFSKRWNLRNLRNRAITLKGFNWLKEDFLNISMRIGLHSNLDSFLLRKSIFTDLDFYWVLYKVIFGPQKKKPLYLRRYYWRLSYIISIALVKKYLTLMCSVPGEWCLD